MEQRYVVVGAGGTGTFLLDPLIRYLASFYGNTNTTVWQVGVIDGDEVSESNLSRQLFSSTDITVNKANAVKARFADFPNVIAIPEYLGRDNLPRYIQDGSIVFIAVDNFPVRANIERHCYTLNNVVVINGGNEETTGSCQMWIRKEGQDITPRLSFLHPEILSPGADRAEMTCHQIAELPGGGQLITANMASAMWMLEALIKYHNSDYSWTEMQFDLIKGESLGMDHTDKKGWNNVPAN